MGGNALKVAKTRRLSKAEYDLLAPRVVSMLRDAFIGYQVMATKAYRGKESFGDLDVVIGYDGTNRLTKICQAFRPTETYHNGDALSFNYQEFQVDAIFVDPLLFETAVDYYSWNDLGNLVGRLAHKLGFKYGHKGLYYTLRDGDHVIKDILVSTSTRDIFAFLDLDYNRFKFGFDTLEDIFMFVASSTYFNRDIYLLENRNAKARMRDSKRKTYNYFLEWVAQQENLTAYPWEQLSELGPRTAKHGVLQNAFLLFSGFRYEHAEAEEGWAVARAVKARFNGQLVASWTGLAGKELGDLIRRVKERFGEDFETRVLQMHATELESFVQETAVLMKTGGTNASC